MRSLIPCLLFSAAAAAQDLKVLQAPSAEPRPQLASDVALGIRAQQVEAYKIAIAEQQQQIAALEAQIQAMNLQRQLEMKSKLVGASLENALELSKLDAGKWLIDPDSLEVKRNPNASKK